MLSSSLHALLSVLVLAVLSVSAKPGLSVAVSGPASVTGVQNLKVVATITNTGDETLKILNDPRGLLSKRPANKFTITSSHGGRPAFHGIKVKYSPTVAAQAGDFTVLPPGSSIDVSHDLSEAYNFTSSGVGAYEFEADNLFYIVNDNNEVSTLWANQAQAYTASVAGNLAIARSEPFEGLTRRATFIGCTAARQTLINTAAASAQTYAANALSYVTAHTTASTRFTTWFGSFTTARRSTILSHFTKISGSSISGFTFDCSCTDTSYAYVYPGTFGKIYLCGAFWNAPNTGTDSKAGTLVHETSHFTANGGTDDYAYGQSAAKSLATSNPAQAIMNADSHEYFAENYPVLA